MRLVFLIVITSFYFFGNAQSKKEQIQILSNRLDSLKTVQSSENLSYTKRKTELETSISNSDQKTSELLKTLSTKKENLQNQISENQKLDQAILSLKLELKSVEDSIQKILDEQPLEFINNSSSKLSDNELIRLINVTILDLEWDLIGDKEILTDIFISVSGKQIIQLGGKKYCIAVLSVMNPNTFGSSYGTSMIGLLEEKNGNWTLLKKTNTHFGSRYGESSSLEKFRLIGDKALSIEISNYLTGGGGYVEEQRKIYALINNDLFLVYEGHKHSDDLGRTGSSVNSSDTEVNFKKNNLKFYHLEVVEKKNGKRIKQSVLKFNETTMKYE